MGKRTFNVKLARSLPSAKELARVERAPLDVPHPEGETERPSGLVLP